MQSYKLYKINNKKGFTLIEMLIVIVIIGILASALIPRLTTARGRANDTARKADLQQIATALITYQIDYGRFPKDSDLSTPTISSIESDLQAVGMTLVPKDPSKDRSFNAITEKDIAKNGSCWDGETNGAGEYQYRTISKNSIRKAGFVLVAGVETKGGANRLYSKNTYVNTSVYTSDGCVASDTEEGQIDLCENITDGTYSASDRCQLSVGEDMLRYIYTY